MLATHGLRVRFLVTAGLVTFVAFNKLKNAETKCEKHYVDETTPQECLVKLFTATKQRRMLQLEKELSGEMILFSGDSTCDKFDGLVAPFDREFFVQFSEFSARSKNWTRSKTIKEMPIMPEPTSDAEMVERQNLLKRGCSLFVDYRRLLLQPNTTDLLEQLRDLQHKALSNQTNVKPINANFFLPSSETIERNFRSLFFIDQHQIGPLCLPPKTGTTNWQRSLTALMLNSNRSLDQELIDPASIYDQIAFSAIPRYYSKYNGQLFPQYSKSMKNCIKEKLLTRARSDSISWLIIRHPFERLYSAWNQKFKNDYSGLNMYQEKFKSLIF